MSSDMHQARQGREGHTDADWADLMRAAIAGDGRAYARLLTEITPVLRGIVRARGRSLAPDQHEDIVQEVLLAIHAKRHTWRSDHPIRPWLYAIARHKVVDAFRKRGATVDLPIEDFAEVIAAEAGPDPLAGRDVDRLVARLDPRSAEIIRAVALREEPQAEVGARLGMTDTALRVALHRAMKKLESWGRGAS
jgi:RNA polymerase sigma factor (sigma-70 family)